MITIGLILLVSQIHAKAQGPELIIESGHSSLVSSIAFSPDGKLMASASGSIKLWNVESGREIKTLGENNSDGAPELELPIFVTHSLAFLTGGNLLVAANYKKIRVWNIATSEAKTLYESAAYIRSFALSPDGSTFAVGLSDRTVKLCDVATGQELHTLSGHVDPLILSITFSPDGKTLASSAGFDDKTIRLWDTATGRELRVLYGLSAGVSSLAFSPDGKTLASTGDINNGIKLWDVASGRELQTLYGHRDFVESVNFSLDGKTLASAGSFRDGTIKLWDVVTGQVVRSFPDTSTVFCVEFSPDGKTLASAGAGEDAIHIRLWDVGAGLPRRTLTGHSNWISIFASSPDGKSLATSGGKQIIKLWNVAGGQVLKSLAGHRGIVRALAFSPDGKILASGSEDKTIKLWDVASGQELKSFGGNTNFPLLLIFSPDGKTLISCLFGDSVTYYSDNGRTTTTSSLGGTIRLWDVALGRELGSYKGYDPIGFSPDYKMVASTIKDSRGQVGNDIKVLNLYTGEQTILRGHTGKVALVGFTPDGKSLASTSEDQTIRFWDLSTGQATIFASNNIYMFIAFSPDGRKIAVGSRERRVVELWDVATGHKLRGFNLNEPSAALEVFKVVPNYLRNYYGEVMSDGSLKIRLGENGRLNLFEFKTGKLLSSLIALDENDWAAITPDGRFDTDNLENPAGLHWLYHDAPLMPISFEIFMRDYFEPKLLPRLLKCTKESNCDRELKPVRDLSSLNRTQPRVEITNISRTGSPNTVEVSAEVDDVVSEIQKDMSGSPLSSGVYDVRLFREGQLVGSSTPNEKLQTTFRSYQNFDEELSAWREASKVDLVHGKKTLTFTVKLPSNSKAKDIEFSAYAFNEDRVKSETARVRWSPAETAKPVVPATAPVKPRAYVTSVGVNANDNPAFNLQFAANDARRFQEVLLQRLAATGEYSEVVPITLVSDWELRGGRQVTTRRDATKANIKAVLDLLAGRSVPADIRNAIPGAEKLRQSTPDDLVLILFSSHGYADRNGIFYFIPYDTGPGACKVFSETVRQRSISTDELSLWLRDVDAGQMTLIVDACYSTAAIEGSGFKPGPMGSRGLGQLAYDKRMRILTATQADNVAMELPATADGKPIMHGLLTYALLENGLGENQADFKPHDNIIYLDEWLEFGVANTPKLSASQPQPASSSPRSTRRKDRSRFVLLKRGLADLGACEQRPAGPARIQEQLPSLFDFTRRKREVALAKNP